MKNRNLTFLFNQKTIEIKNNLKFSLTQSNSSEPTLIISPNH